MFNVTTIRVVDDEHGGWNITIRNHKVNMRSKSYYELLPYMVGYNIRIDIIIIMIKFSVSSIRAFELGQTAA